MKNETRGKGEASPNRIRAARRSERAVRHRLAGKTFQQIADLLGYENRSSAYHAVKAGMYHGVKEPARELVEIESLRLERLQAAHWAKAIRGDVQSTITVLRIMKQRADLLGLNAPKELDITLEAAEIAAKEGLDPAEVIKVAQEWIREQAK